MPLELFVATILGGLCYGLVDAVLTLRGFPNPASSSYLLGYVVGPLVASVGWALIVLLIAAPLMTALGVTKRRRLRLFSYILATTWWIGLVVVISRGGASMPAKAAALALATLAAASFAHLIADSARRVQLASRPVHLLTLAGPMLLLGILALAITPSGLAALRSSPENCDGQLARTSTDPNVLLITVDTLRLDSALRMRAYQWLATSGVEYSRHISTSPWTLPAIASLLTGLPLEVHGAGRPLDSSILQARAPLPEHAETIAHTLARRGYWTQAVVTNPFLSSAYGIDQGFCSFENLTMEGEAFRRFRETTALRLLTQVSAIPDPSDRAEPVLERAQEYLFSLHDDARPFFFWVHLIDPHAPYGDRDDIPSTFATDLLAFQGSEGIRAPFAGLARIRAGEVRPDAREREIIRSYYEDDVRSVDAALLPFLLELRDRGILESTAVILTSDHGEEFWEHGGVEHGHTLFDEVLRIPLVVRPSGGSEHRRVDDFTVIARLPEIIRRLVADPDDGSPTLPPSSDAARLGGILFGEDLVGIRTTHQKYIRHMHGTELLFDLEADPRELQNLAVAEPSTVATLRPLARSPGEG